MSTTYKPNVIDEQFNRSVKILIDVIIAMYKEELNIMFDINKIDCFQRIKESIFFRSRYRNIKESIALLNETLSVKAPKDEDPFYTLYQTYHKLIEIKEEWIKADRRIERTIIKLFNNSLLSFIVGIIYDIENKIRRHLNVSIQPYFTSLGIDMDNIRMADGCGEYLAPRLSEIADKLFANDDIYNKGSLIIALLTVSVVVMDTQTPNISIKTLIDKFERDHIKEIEESGWCFYYKLKANIYAAVLDSKIKGEELCQQLRT